LPTSSDNNKGTTSNQGQTGDAGGGLVDQLKQEHRQIAGELDKADFDAQKVARLWARHVSIEEKVLVPALKGAGVEPRQLAEFSARRDMVRVLLRHMMDAPDATSLRDLLKQQIGELTAAEERKETGLYHLGDKEQLDLVALGRTATERGQQFDSNADVDFRQTLEPTHFRSEGSGQRQYEENSMPDNMRERDDNGRFRSYDDDRRRGGGGGRDRDDRGRFMSDDDRGYRSRDDDYRRSSYDDDRRYSSSRYDDDRNRDRERDDRGRFVSDDDRGYRSRSDDDYRRSDYDDDRRYSSSRYDDDDDRRSSGEGRGWFGDPRGHSEASRRGWEHRDDRYSRSDDDRRYSRSSRDDDDDDRGRGRGHGGWFGDSRGHSEAARRGWEDRR